MRMTIRADASDLVGAGHFMRCVALADRVAALGGCVTFLAAHAHPVITGTLANRVHGLLMLNLPHDATPEADALASTRALDGDCDWLVVDHYGFDDRWEASLRERARKVLVIDDLADRRHDCDVLVDPGYGRKASDYAALVPSHAAVLVGTRYALLRQPFAAKHDAAPTRGERRHVHIFFGSGDTSMQWLAQYCGWLLDAFRDIHVRAVGRGDRWAIQALVQQYPARFDWKEQVEDMAAHMSTCDVAIGAPGSATWERACVGLASAIVATAENQLPILHVLDSARFCRFLGCAWELDAPRFTAGIAAFLDDDDAITEMRARGVAAVDGRGVNRIVRNLARQGASR